MLILQMHSYTASPVTNCMQKKKKNLPNLRVDVDDTDMCNGSLLCLQQISALVSLSFNYI